MEHLLAALYPQVHAKFPLPLPKNNEDTHEPGYILATPYQAFMLDPALTAGTKYSTSSYNSFRIMCLTEVDGKGRPTGLNERSHRRLFNRIVDLVQQGMRSTIDQQFNIWEHLFTDARQQLGFCRYLIERSWLGALRRFTKIEDIPQAEFIQEVEPSFESPFGLTLTTHKLRIWLRIWESRVASIQDEIERAAEIARAREELREDNLVLHSLNIFLTNVYPKIPDDWLYGNDDPLGSTHCACVLMLQALLTAAEKMSYGNGTIRRGSFPGSEAPWLRQRFRLERWCPYTISRIFAACEVDEVAVIYAVGTARNDNDHKKCTPQSCLANSAMESKLQQPSHVCLIPTECADWDLPVQSIVAIIANGATPVLQISLVGEDVNVQICAAGNHRYIAVSHLWADGLGAISRNAIATCQLLQLKKRLLDIEQAEECDDICVWIDTLCIPIGEEYQHVRNDQINKMTSIYQEAFAVLVMDADLSLIRPAATLLDVAARLAISAWSSRLWTYQEGMLNRRIFLMTQQGVQDLDALTARALKLEAGPEPPDHNLLEKAIHTVAVSIGRPHSVAHWHNGCSVPAKFADKFRALHIHSKEKGDMDGQRLLYAIRDRTSTRLDDEAVIIASALGLDVSKIMMAPSDRKMVTLLQSMAYIPSNMLFSLGPRLALPGYRWAPASVLIAKKGRVVVVVNDMVPYSKWSTQFGVSNLGTSEATRPCSKLAPDDRGLLTLNPALRLNSFHSVSSRMDSIIYTVGGTPYALVAAHVDPRNKDVDMQRSKEIKDMLRQGKSLVVLLPDFHPNNVLEWGVLAELLWEPLLVPDYHGGNAVIAETTVVRYCMPVQLQPKSVLQAVPKSNAFRAGSNPSTVVGPYTGFIDGKRLFGPALPPDMFQERRRLQEVQTAEDNAREELRDHDAEWIWPRWWLVD